MNRGAVTVIQVIGTGVVAFGVFLGGLLFTKAQASDAKILNITERTATLEEAVRTIKTDISEIKVDNKTTAQNIGMILIKLDAKSTR